jgi:hypothetical protein
MQFTAQLDVDVVALEAEDEVTCLVSLTAPVPDEVADRGINLQSRGRDDNERRTRNRSKRGL